MKIKVYRGTQEIGGTCVQIIADNGKILWIDIGLPLSKENANTDYVENKVDAILISHPHADHSGLIEKIKREVQVFIGQVGLDLLNATRIFRGLPNLNQNFQLIYAWKTFAISDTFKVTPYLTDHSTPESFAFLIEADGKRVFYSGDFRATGRKAKLFDAMLQNPLNNIDILLTEGTMVERDNHKYSTEVEVEAAMEAVIRKQTSSTFVISSAQNIDRFISVFKACRNSNKKLIIDPYAAYVLEMVRKVSKSIPGMDWEEIKVFEHPGMMNKVTATLFDDFSRKIKLNRIGNEQFANPSNYVYFVRCPNEKLVEKLKKAGRVTIIYSQWDGYLKKENSNYCSDYLNQLKHDEEVDFLTIHTSGHATVDDLTKFAKALNPKLLIPIHTQYPELMKAKLESSGVKHIELWEDNIDYTV